MHTLLWADSETFNITVFNGIFNFDTMLTYITLHLPIHLSSSYIFDDLTSKTK